MDKRGVVEWRIIRVLDHDRGKVFCKGRCISVESVLEARIRSHGRREYQLKIITSCNVLECGYTSGIRFLAACDEVQAAVR